MEHVFEVIHRAGVKHPTAEPLSRRSKERTDDSEIEDDIPEMAVATRATSRQNRLVDTTPEKNLNEIREPTIPLREEIFYLAKHQRFLQHDTSHRRSIRVVIQSQKQRTFRETIAN